MKEIKGRETEIINSEARFLRAPTLKECLERITIKKVEKKYTGLHKLIANPEFLIIAYNNIRKNKGLETTSVDEKILDSLNYKKFELLGKEINTGIYKPKPSKIIYITNPKGGLRPLGLPCSIDKIIQEAVRIILEYIYEPKFLSTSHGFRPNKGCHSALNYYKMRFQGISWLINIDIQGYFDNIDHAVLIETLSKDIDDKPFFDLMWKFLNAGYIFDNKIHKLKLGVPQGSIIGPILCNVYLHQLDVYMKIFKNSFDIGARRSNSEYTQIVYKGKHSSVIARKNNINPLLINDKNFKRLVYLRYANDFIIGIDASKEEAYTVYESIKEFLMETLKFNIKDNSQILHYRTEKTEFLGVEIKGSSKSNVPLIKYLGRKARSSIRPLIIMPLKKIKDKLIEYNFIKSIDNVYKPTRCGRLIHHDLHKILSYYNSIYRGLCGYYYICMNRALLRNIHYFLKYSCALTIASKMKLKTKAKVFKKYGDSLSITLKGKTIRFIDSDYWKHLKLSTDIFKEPVIDTLRKYTNYTPKSGLFDCCVSCGSVNNLEMHHVNKQSNIKDSLSYLERIRIANLRKQVVLCKDCHIKVHKGIYSGEKL